MTRPARPTAATAVAVPLACLALLAAGCGADAGTTASGTTSAGGTTTTSAAASPTPSATSAPAPSPATSGRSHPATTSRTSRTTTHAAGPSTPATVAARGPQPTRRFPANPPAVGSGAHAVVSAVPDAEWAAMAGTSWTAGCPVGRSGLRQVSVNFWGFDGRRSRGSLVVSSRIAAAAAGAFSSLYDQHFRIRLMRPMDRSWGKNPKGPGADDYAAMDADNTSAFNCRYVGGQESRKVWSNHAYGLAIDVDDLENPYVDDDGTVYPNAYWLHRRSPAPGVFSSSGSAAVRAFTARGFRWGGLWSHPDLQHFEVSR